MSSTEKIEMAMAKSITAPALIDEEAPENRPNMLLVHSRFCAFAMEYAVIRGKHSASRWPFNVGMAGKA
jgi:hypothetical protein